MDRLTMGWLRDGRRLGRRWPVVAAMTGGLWLAACGGVETERDFPERNRGIVPEGSVFGSGGIRLFGSGEDVPEDQAGPPIGVNSFLWRGALDTVSFMPVTSADPFGGVILTDWYTPPETPDERFKLNIFILDRQLRADGIRVAVFRQVRDVEAGTWVDADVDAATTNALEETILTRARELRAGSIAAAQ